VSEVKAVVALVISTSGVLIIVLYSLVKTENTTNA
jgi:hypothetical protein